QNAVSMKSMRLYLRRRSAELRVCFASFSSRAGSGASSAMCVLLPIGPDLDGLALDHLRVLRAPRIVGRLRGFEPSQAVTAELSDHDLARDTERPQCAQFLKRLLLGVDVPVGYIDNLVRGDRVRTT